MLIAQIDYLTLNARELTRPMCFDFRATLAQLSRVARVLCVFRLSHTARPRNTHGQGRDYFHEINSFFWHVWERVGWTREGFDYIITSKMLYFVSNLAWHPVDI